MNSHRLTDIPGPILITGAGGFIGSHLLESFLDVRSDVVGTVHEASNWRLSDEVARFAKQLDLSEQTTVRRVIAEVQPRTIFHLATYGGYPSQIDSKRIYKTNLLGLVNLVTELLGLPIHAFIHAGTSSEYGFNCSAPSEDSALEPNSDYSVSKIAASKYLEFVAQSHHFPATNLRLYSVYGPKEEPSRLIPTLLRNASTGKLPKFVNPATSRDFVFVDDVVEAFVLAALTAGSREPGRSFNIGTGRKTTIEELAFSAKDMFGIADAPEFSMESRKWDRSEWFSDPSRARAELGWVPRTDLEEGLKKTLAAMTRSNPKSSQSAEVPDQPTRVQSKVSAVVACYLDAEAIPIMYERLIEVFAALNVDYEIIFVNDGSPDNSEAEIVKISAVDDRVLGITHSRNFGSQLAFWSGLRLSTGDCVVLLDGDLQDPPEVIRDFVGKWREGFDVVYGRRDDREMGRFKHALYRGFYRAFAKLSDVPIPVDAGDFSLMDRRVVETLLQSDERDLFLRGLRAHIGFRQTGVPYFRPERMFGRSTNSLLKNVGWAKKAFFSFSAKPASFLTNLGALILALTFVLAIVVTALKIIVPDSSPPGISALLVVTLALGGITTFGLGIIGEYVSRIFIEVKRRPAPVVARIVARGLAEEQAAPLHRGRQ